MQRTPDGNGYWMLRADGYVYAFGDAHSYGNVAGCANYHGARSLLVSPDGLGYWIGTNDGSVIPLGDARKLGMPSAINAPPVGIDACTLIFWSRSLRSPLRDAGWE